MDLTDKYRPTSFEASLRTRHVVSSLKDNNRERQKTAIYYFISWS